MGNDLPAYRASIGNFYNRTYSAQVFKKFSRYFCFPDAIKALGVKIICAINKLHCRLLCNIGNINIIFLLVISLHLIAQQCDIEKNPGPSANISALSDTSDTNSGLTILHLNTRSIRNKLNSILDFADGMNILCFTETHLDDNINTSDLILENYDMPYRLDRTSHGGGILVYVMKGIVSHRRTDLENIDDEVIWFEIVLNSVRYLISVTYRPPNTPQQFWNRLERSLSLALDETNYVAVLGDLNIDFFQPLPLPVLDLIHSKGLINIITDPTRISQTRRSLLDPILITESIKVIEQGTISVETEISDHEATFAVLTSPCGIHSVFRREIWLYNRCITESLRHDIQSTDWTTILNNNTVDEASNRFTEELLKIARKNIPNKIVTIRKNDKPWFNNEIRKAIRKRDRLRKIAIKTNTQLNKNKYKLARNKVTKLKREARENYFLNLEENILQVKSTNPKLYWKLMKNLIKSDTNNDPLPPLRSAENNSYAYSDQDKCELLKSYFCSISSVDDSNTNLPDFAERSINSLIEIKILKQEIQDIIKNLDPKKAKRS